MPRLAVAVAADDLTGAMDTGHEFAARGHPTFVTVRGDASVPADAGVLVADTESRYDSPDAAARAVYDALDGHEADVVYKKVDSTLRGNLVAEVDAAVDAVGADIALVAPAFPRNGRLTAEGYHLVDGALVTRTPAGRDPDKPVTSAHLPTLFADSAYPVRRVSVGDVAAGADAVADALRDVAADADRPVLAVADAVAESHLEALAAGGAATDLSVVYVGSAGLAAHVSVPADADAGDESSPGAPGDGADGDAASGTDTDTDTDADADAARAVLGVAGSTAPETRAQVAVVDGVVPLDLETAVTDPEAAADAAAADCAARLVDGGAALLASAGDDADPERALRAGRKHGLHERVVRERISTALSLAVARVWDRAPPDGLFLTGGAVAVRVLRELDAGGVSLAGEAVEAGIPLGRVRGGRADGTPVVTKAGAFGSEGAIANCLARLGGHHE